MIFDVPVIDFILHFDNYLPGIIEQYGVIAYLLLFIIIFCETGLVVAPYLPGDSLLFVSGALAANGMLDPWVLVISLSIAAILGDSLNYWIGYRIGKRFIEKHFVFVKPDHLRRTEQFFEKYGGKTIIIARFVPFIRTFAPFLAGVGQMQYTWFLTYNIVGGVAWVLAFVLGGYFVGRLPIVQENFGIIVYLVIALSLLVVASIFWSSIKSHRASQRMKEKMEGKR